MSQRAPWLLAWMVERACRPAQAGLGHDARQRACRPAATPHALARPCARAAHSRETQTDRSILRSQ
eukprot:7483598-Alexandrium_andersonii.AAC.1